MELDCRLNGKSFRLETPYHYRLWSHTFIGFIGGHITDFLFLDTYTEQQNNLSFAL